MRYVFKNKNALIMETLIIAELFYKWLYETPWNVTLSSVKQVFVHISKTGFFVFGISNVCVLSARSLPQAGWNECKLLSKDCISKYSIERLREEYLMLRQFPGLKIPEFSVAFCPGAVHKGRHISQIYPPPLF